MPIVPLPTLWNLLMSGLAPIWPPSRTAINGISLGDAWPCSSMPQPATSPSGGGAGPSFSPFPNTSTRSGPAAAWESILPFHKLTQWLTYSLMQPMQQLMKIHFAGQELLTGLPEYRNGGLFVDLGVMTLKNDDMIRGLQNYKDYCIRTGDSGIEVAPMFEPSDDVIVEWRGATVGLLDRLCADVNQSLRNELAGHELTLPQLLEAGSWKVRGLRLTGWPQTGIHADVLCNRVVVKLLRSTGQIPRNRQFSSTAMERCFSGAPMLSFSPPNSKAGAIISTIKP